MSQPSETETIDVEALEASGPCPSCGGTVILRGTIRAGAPRQVTVAQMLEDQRRAWEYGRQKRARLNLVAIWWMSLSLVQVVAAILVMIGPEQVSRWLAAVGFLVAGFAMAIAGGWLAELKGASLWRR